MTEVYTFKSHKYISRSLRAMFVEKGAFLNLFLSMLILIIPILGFIWIQGYIVKCVKKIAFGIRTSYKVSDLAFLSCMKLGFRASVIELIYGVVIGLFKFSIDKLTNETYGLIPLTGLTGFLFSIVMAGITMLLTFIVSLAVVRYAIYEEFGAAFDFKQMLEMLKNDFGGVCRICGSALILTSVFMLLVFILVGIVIASWFLSFIQGDPTTHHLALTLSATGNSDYFGMMAGFLMFAPMVVAGIILVFTISFGLNMFFMGFLVAFWTIQYDVPSWGARTDELPGQLEDGQCPNLPRDEEEKMEPSSCEPSCSCVSEKIETTEICSCDAKASVHDERCDCHSDEEACECSGQDADCKCSTEDKDLTCDCAEKNDAPAESDTSAE